MKLSAEKKKETIVSLYKEMVGLTVFLSPAAKLRDRALLLDPRRRNPVVNARWRSDRGMIKLDWWADAPAAGTMVPVRGLVVLMRPPRGWWFR